MFVEKKFFLKIMRDYLAGRQSAQEPNLNWFFLEELANAHQVQGIMYVQCKNYLPKEVRKHLERAFYAALYNYKKRERCLLSISETFKKVNIPYFTIKGLDIAHYYPYPALRTMGDMDLVVHEDDKRRAGESLEKLGFIKNYEFTGKEIGYLYQGLQYELHYELVYDELVTKPIIKQYFNKCWDFVSGGKLDHSFHFIFLLVHLRKHLMHEGAGFRQFMDIGILIKNDNTLNWPWIERCLQELNLIKFAGVCFGLIERWFEIKAPISFPKPDNDFMVMATEKIFTNGVFGFNNAANNSNSVVNQLRKYNGPRWMRRIILLVERAFPSYDYLKIGSNYTFMNKRPWLLPFAWIYRFYLVMTGKTTNGEKIIGIIMTPDDIIDSRNEELRQWGLID